MRRLIWLIVLPLCCFTASAQRQTETKGSAVRQPFTLKLRIDKDHTYEQQFDKEPYVADNSVYLFAGDKFGVKVSPTEEAVSVSYEPDFKKADIQFEFRQEKGKGGKGVMLLLTQNKLDRRLTYRAIMIVPDRKEPLKTSVLPVEAHLASFETWPHPIVQLVLSDFRLSESSLGGQRSRPN